MTSINVIRIEMASVRFCTFAFWSCLAALCTNKEKGVRYCCLFLVSCGNVRCAGDAKGDLDYGACLCLGVGAGKLELLDFAIYTSKSPRVPLSLDQEGEAPNMNQNVRYQRYPSKTRDNLDATSTVIGHKKRMLPCCLPMNQTRLFVTERICAADQCLNELGI